MAMMVEPIRCARTLDAALDRLCADDPEMARLRREAPPVPLRALPPGFAGLARIVIGQQVSAKVAAVLSARLEDALGTVTAERHLEAGPDVWRACGLSRPKQATLAGIAEAMMSGALDLGRIAALPADDAVAALVRLKGIGPWTAEVWLLFAEGHPDIFPSGDLALAEAVRRIDGLEARPAPKPLAQRAESWAPVRSAAARLMWAHYSGDPAAAGANP